MVGSGGWLNEGIIDAIAHANYEGYRIVRPLRFVEDAEIVDLYSGARCAVLPSFHEGFGMTVLEALACGTRVVAADLGSIREAGGDLVTLLRPPQRRQHRRRAAADARDGAGRGFPGQGRAVRREPHLAPGRGDRQATGLLARCPPPGRSIRLA